MTTDLDAYRTQATLYDARTSAFQSWRNLVVDELAAGPGDTVLDVGCGTGLCLARLREKVGATGTVVGVDQSSAMIELARRRVAENGWNNVHLVAAPVHEAKLGLVADAAIFCAVHDVMQSTEALENIFGQLRDGAAVAAIGGKWPSPWLLPLRAWVSVLHAPFVSDFKGFDLPWRYLMGFVPDLSVRELAAGAGYLATGHAKQA
jgi:SAM-dependent methyltransferase